MAEPVDGRARGWQSQRRAEPEDGRATGEAYLVSTPAELMLHRQVALNPAGAGHQHGRLSGAAATCDRLQNQRLMTDHVV